MKHLRLLFESKIVSYDSANFSFLQNTRNDLGYQIGLLAAILSDDLKYSLYLVHSQRQVQCTCRWECTGAVQQSYFEISVSLSSLIIIPLHFSNKVESNGPLCSNDSSYFKRYWWEAVCFSLCSKRFYWLASGQFTSSVICASFFVVSTLDYTELHASSLALFYPIGKVFYKVYSLILTIKSFTIFSTCFFFYTTFISYFKQCSNDNPRHQLQRADLFRSAVLHCRI